jgi:hypothetical protein
MVNQNTLLLMSSDPHNNNALVSGPVYKQRQASYTNASMPSAWVTYISGVDGSGGAFAQLIQGTCDTSANCTISSSDQNDSGTYTPNPVGTPPVSLPQAAVASDGRVTYSSGIAADIIFYLYDTVSGGAVVLQTDNPSLGYMKPQGMLPSGVGSLAASYYMGDLATMDPNGSGNTGSFTLDSSGNMNGSGDKGGQGNVKYGDPLTGLTLTLPTGFATLPGSYGVFNVTQGGNIQIICYVIDPVAAGGPLTNPPSTPYADFACIGPNDGNAKVTLMQQVQ